MYLLLRRVDLDELRRLVQAVRLVPFALSVIIFMVSFVFRAYQWRAVLTDTQSVQIRHLFTAIMIGFTANSVLPARAGEFIRAGVLSRRQGIPFTTSLASVVATRLLDGLCFIGMFTAALFLLRLDEPLIVPAGSFVAEPFVITRQKMAIAATLVAVTFMTATACAIALYVLRKRAIRLAERMWRPTSKRTSAWIAHKVGTFTEGFTVFGRGSRFARSLGLTIVVWTIATLSLYPLMMAVPMGVRLPWWSALVVCSLANLGSMIPVTPGFIGTFHACVIGALKLCCPAIEYDVAVAFSLVLHASQLVPIVIAGVISLWAENVPLAALRQTPPASPERGVELGSVRDPENR
jgi:uncharacterized protein (TIRG00374 family)